MIPIRLQKQTNALLRRLLSPTTTRPIVYAYQMDHRDWRPLKVRLRPRTLSGSVQVGGWLYGWWWGHEQGCECEECDVGF